MKYIPTKSKLYLLIIGLLAATNMIWLFIFLNNKEGKMQNHGNRAAMVKNFLQSEINFNAQQLLQYDSLSKAFKEKTKATFEISKATKSEEFKILGKAAFNDSVITVMSNQSAENQKQIELQLLHHVVNVRKICTAEQLPKFDSLFYTIWNKKKKTE